MVRELRTRCLPYLERTAVESRRTRAMGQLRDEPMELGERCRARLDGMIENAPVVRALEEIQRSSEQLEQRRGQLQAQWDGACRSFSWWNKMKYGPRPDFSAMSAVLTEAREQLERRHGADLAKLEVFVDRAKRSVTLRLEAARASAESFIIRART